jgi:hypothetical protein
MHRNTPIGRRPLEEALASGEIAKPARGSDPPRPNTTRTGLTVLKTPHGRDDLGWTTAPAGTLYVVDFGARAELAKTAASALWKVTGPFTTNTGRGLCDALAVRKAFAHDAVVRLAPGGNDGAPGAAITLALCGHWEHEPPCPLAPHHTRAEPAGDELRLRILFAVEPEREDEVRQRIDGALASPQLVGPDGGVTTWELRGTQRGDVLKAELDHAGRLMRS